MTLFNLPPYLDWPAQLCLFSTLATYVASIVTKNASQVDRLWTFLPTIYTAYYALLPLLPNAQPFMLVPYAPKELGWSTVKDFSPRALLMFSLVSTWMCRLSYNTYRRGLFNLKEEDYRWAVLRKQIPTWLFHVVNLSFIAAIQNILLLLLGQPTHTASVLQPHTALALSDYALAALALVILALEFTADNQQYAFHAYKHAYFAKEKGIASAKAYDPKDHWPGARLAWTPDDAKRGFITRGLWKYVRHPNFSCEQDFWWIITLFPLLSPSAPNLPHLSLSELLPAIRTTITSILNPALRQTLIESLRATLLPLFYHLLPAIALSGLFFSSTLYTEAISSSKYPEAYAAYQKRVGMFAPTVTFTKGLRLKFLDGVKEEKEVERLVWGAVKED
ncbi:hypothetical protein BDZ97DRAFT_1800620 [Flammula alnicola]|nr:hypothetical protein BDZ97DRAFT_1800620 [Flammula alnicola]